MNFFEDSIPDEREPENQEMLDLLKRYSTHPASNTTAEQEQILVRARARLLQTQIEMTDEEIEQAPDSPVLIPLPASISQHDMRRHRSSRSVRILSTIAAAIALVILLGASFLVFAQYASHHVHTVKYTSTPMSSPVPTLQPVTPIPYTGPCLFGYDADAGLVYVCQHHLYQDMSLTKDMGDYTITIKQAYADATRIVIAYTIYKGKTNVSGSVQANLSYMVGQTISSTQSSSQSLPQAVVTSFDVDPTQLGNVPTLPLHLQVFGLNSATGGVIDNGLSTDFNFTLTYHAENRISNVNQSSVANGIKLTLTQMLVSLSEVRLSFTTSSQNVMLDNMRLDVDGERYGPVSGSSSGGTMQTLSAGGSLLQKHGRWTLTVTGFISPNGSPSGTPVGPWVFHVVP